MRYRFIQLLRLLILIMALQFQATGQSQTLRFDSFESLQRYADTASRSLRNSDEQQELSRQQTLAAKLNAFNFKPITSFSLTDNTQLNVMFIPAEAFGGPPGTFRELKTGQQFITNFNITPTLDVLNPQALGKIKVARAWEEVTASNNLTVKRNLHESLANVYYNLISVQEQLQLTRLQLQNLDSILLLIEARKQEGLIRQQDLNLLEVNRITVNNKKTQLEIQLKQQTDVLRSLLDVSANQEIIIAPETKLTMTQAVVARSALLTRQKEAMYRYYQHDLKATWWGMMPTVSLFGSYAMQQNTNDHFFDDARWIKSSYIGVRVSVPLVDFTKTANVAYLKINTRMADNDRLHAALQDSLSNRQLTYDYEKALHDYDAQDQIVQLRSANYQKAQALYREGLISCKELLDASNEVLISSANRAAAAAVKSYCYTRILIHNQIQ